MSPLGNRRPPLSHGGAVPTPSPFIHLWLYSFIHGFTHSFVRSFVPSPPPSLPTLPRLFPVPVLPDPVVLGLSRSRCLQPGLSRLIPVPPAPVIPSYPGHGAWQSWLILVLPAAVIPGCPHSAASRCGPPTLSQSSRPGYPGPGPVIPGLSRCSQAAPSRVLPFPIATRRRARGKHCVSPWRRRSAPLTSPRPESFVCVAGATAVPIATVEGAWLRGRGRGLRFPALCGAGKNARGRGHVGGGRGGHIRLSCVGLVGF